MHIINKSYPRAQGPLSLTTIPSSTQVILFQVIKPFPAFHPSPFLESIFYLAPMLPPFHGSSHCPLILDVESCQILFKIKALFIQPLNLLHFMTGISSRTSIRFVKHDLLCLGPCSLLSVKWLFPGVLLSQLLRIFPRTPSIPKQTRCYPC